MKNPPDEKPIYTSNGYQLPITSPPPYWSTPFSPAIGHNLTCEFSAGISWLFPRAHLLGYAVDPAQGLLKLKFPFRSLHVKMWSAAQAGLLIHGILRGKCSVLLACDLAAAAGRPTETCWHPDAGSGPLDNVICVMNMEIKDNFN